MKLDAVEYDLANKNIEDFISRIYRSNVSQYLEVDDIGNIIHSLISKSKFKELRINLFSNWQKNENSMIENVLQSYTIIFLDIQATKEIEYKTKVEYF